jgi:plastocyanin
MIKIGKPNVEYSYFPARTRAKDGMTVTFTNVGDFPHPTRYKKAEWIPAYWRKASQR